MILYEATSRGRRIGCKKVLLPSNNLAMNTPMGFAKARIMRKKTTICKTPLLVTMVSEDVVVWGQNFSGFRRA
jgi:hypothetical protein